MCFIYTVDKWKHIQLTSIDLQINFNLWICITFQIWGRKPLPKTTTLPFALRYIAAFGGLTTTPFIEKENKKIRKNIIQVSIIFNNFLGKGSPSPLPSTLTRSISGFALGSGFALNSRALCAISSSFVFNLPLRNFDLVAPQKLAYGICILQFQTFSMVIPQTPVRLTGSENDGRDGWVYIGPHNCI